MTSSVKTVTLISSDGEEFEIPIDVAGQSKLIKNMIDDVGDSGKIPLSNVNSATLATVMKYCKKHADHEAAATSDNVGEANDAGSADEELKKWDAEFFKTEKCNELFDIILAANYMDINGLLDASLQAVADSIKNKSPEEIREIFNIQNDFTPEEEDEIRSENRWAFED